MGGFDLRFKNPSSFILAGSSQSGKTTLTFNILRNIETLFTDPRCRNNVIYFYNQWQKSYDLFRKEDIVKEWINLISSLLRKILKRRQCFLGAKEVLF